VRSGGDRDRRKKGWSTPDAIEEAPKAHKKRPSRLAARLVLLAVLAGVVLWLVPMLQVELARERLALTEQLTAADRLALEHQLLQAENSARATLGAILAAAGVLLGAAIIWRRVEASRELKTHERFARAVEQLGSERADGSARTEVRLGGIYALEKLATESEAEYWPVMEVLTAYVRDNAARSQAEHVPPAGPLRPRADIQAVLAVLGRRSPTHSATAEWRLLDLRETDLRGANLSGSRLDGIMLQGAHLDQVDATGAVLVRSNLRGTHLAGASLSQANLDGASLARANLEGARLNGANLNGVDLSGATLRGADLLEANLRGCNLKDADLRGADLSQCVLDEAILWRANLQDAVLTGAHLHETHLERANLVGASGLTWEQGEDAYTDENTVLPSYLLPEEARQPAVADETDRDEVELKRRAAATRGRRRRIQSMPMPGLRRTRFPNAASKLLSSPPDGSGGG
jgi:uncharacterized protein YjbI with pentapeptide repeats